MTGTDKIDRYEARPYGSATDASDPPILGSSQPGTPGFPQAPQYGPQPRRDNGLERAVAAAEGVVEGVAEGVDRHGLADATHRLIDQGDKLASRLRRDERPDRPSRTAQKLHEATGRATAKIHDAQRFVDETVRDVRHKAHAVGETGRRAAQAPAIVSRDLGKAASAWMGGFTTSAAFLAGMGVAGIFALVLLTMGLVAALTPAVGATMALVITGGLYLVGAVACYGAAKAARAKAKLEAQRHVEQARQDLRHVTAPVREAFGQSSPATPLATPRYEAPLQAR